jgi:hypothetical protein
VQVVETAAVAVRLTHDDGRHDRIAHTHRRRGTVLFPP